MIFFVYGCMSLCPYAISNILRFMLMGFMIAFFYRCSFVCLCVIYDILRFILTEGFFFLYGCSFGVCDFWYSQIHVNAILYFFVRCVLFVCMSHQISKCQTMTHISHFIITYAVQPVWYKHFESKCTCSLLCFKIWST